MPATSKAQQRFFAIAEHAPSKLRKAAPKMSKAKMHEFAATKVKNLPAKAPQRGYKKGK